MLVFKIQFSYSFRFIDVTYRCFIRTNIVKYFFPGILFQIIKELHGFF